MSARVPPQNLEAERAVLGAILLSPSSLDEVVELIDADDFYRAGHRHIFTAMRNLAERSEAIDVITLGAELLRLGVDGEAGGSHYLSYLDAEVPPTPVVVRYAQLVRDSSLARRLLETGHAITRDCYEHRGDVAELLDSAETRIFEVTDRRQVKPWTDMKSGVTATFKKLELLYERQEEITGLRTGWTGVDRMTAGLQKKDLIVIAGRPSMGKTAVAMNIAGYVAMDLKKPVAVFSLEMGAESLLTRMLGCEARVDGQRLRTGKLLDSDWPKLARAADRLHRAPLFIDDTAGLSALEMRSKCRRLKAQHKDLALIVVDYLQLMKGRPGTDSREQEISDISRGLKAMAKDLDVPVIALSQLNRGLEKREDKRPMMSDLRESGAIEQDADVIAFVYRDEVYNKESPDKGIAELIIGKQRNGPTGDVRLAFLRDFTRFDNLEEREGM